MYMVSPMMCLKLNSVQVRILPPVQREVKEWLGTLGVVGHTSLLLIGKIAKQVYAPD